MLHPDRFARSMMAYDPDLGNCIDFITPEEKIKIAITRIPT